MNHQHKCNTARADGSCSVCYGFDCRVCHLRIFRDESWGRDGLAGVFHIRCQFVARPRLRQPHMAVRQ